MGSHELSWTKYSRLAGVERTRWGRDSLTRCWVLRERERFLGPDRKIRLGHPDAEPPSHSSRQRTRDGTRPNVENCIVDASILMTSSHKVDQWYLWQVIKGARWMPWHQEPMKDVGGCEKPRGAANRAVIRGCPNGETRLG